MSTLSDLPRAFAGLRVPLICDVLDSLGHRSQAMHHRLRPLDADQSRFVGRARPWHWMQVDYVVEDDPYGLEIAAIDDLRPGDVVVHSTDHADTNAPWGELLSTAAVARGAVGTVCDSQVRDVELIRDVGFPVFARGISPVDSLGRGRVMAFDAPVTCGGVVVKPGEIVFADYDGIVVIPIEVEVEAVDLAHEKSAKEDVSRAELRNGALLRDVFDRHGVL